MILSNLTAMLQVITKGDSVGETTPVTLVDVVDISDDEESDIKPAELPETVDVRRVGEAPARQKVLLSLIPETELLSVQEEEQLHQLITDRHQAFSLDEFDCGETDLLEMQINTADSEAAT